ncbi:PIN domain-containing protein [Actinobacillus equuli subsp. haemolyticus]|uniref:PIN domain-containing protein n=1 Tax=Actinobacillus equuli TaxID=718 RepID=UPI0024429C35|nr:PIN domain-containing protein [Actinobacillus equuli]WGE82229.1 PIN domain-containing protein [Actinobacillus equuli subsp. haemolyticus]
MVKADKHYSALTIDTSIFEKNGLKLNKGLLAKLHQFKDSRINLVLSDVVYLELKSHLNKKEKETKNKIDSALNDAVDYLNCCIDDIEKIKSLMNMGCDAGVISSLILKDFIQKSGIEIIKSEEYCEIQSLINMYFRHHAPFKESGNKKNEFPDAIALLSLECWARGNDKNLLAVSSDNDWKCFSEDKDNVDVIDDLAKAMDVLNRQSQVLDSIIREVQLDLLENKNSEIFKRICSAIEDDVSFFEIEATSAYNYYIDDEQVNLIDVNILKENDRDELKIYIVDINSSEIVISIACEVLCNVEATFHFSVWDSIDKEDVPLGVTTKMREVSYKTDVLVHLYGNSQAGLQNMDIDEIEVLDFLGVVDIGEISPFNDDEDYR